MFLARFYYIGFMTSNYNIGEVETKPLVFRKKYNEETEKYEDDFDCIKTRIDWVSHGNYVLWQPLDDQQRRDNKASGKLCLPYILIPLEAEYFDEIIKAFEEKPQPTTPEEVFEPFWKAVLPPRGMHFFETQVRAYFRGKKGFILHGQRNNSCLGGPCTDIDEMGFTIEDFKKIRDTILISDAEKPFHCCTMTL